MADVSAPTTIFSRESAVLDYWLVHAEGLTIQPLGARVEEVVVTAPVGQAESLIVRSRMTRRRKAIPAASIVAVEPSAGQLLMDAPGKAGPRLHAPHISAERIAAARVNAQRGQQLARAHAAGAVRLLRTGTVVTLSWLRPRVVQGSTTTARHTRLAAAHTARGVVRLTVWLTVWLTPRVVAGARSAGAAAARLTLTLVVIAARGAARTARELERATAFAAERGRASLEARRARRDGEPDA